MKKKLLALLLATAMTASLGLSAYAAEDEEAFDIAPKTGTSQTGPVQNGEIATDVLETDWFYNAVLTVVDMKIMDLADGAFRPAEIMTREQIAVALFNDAVSISKARNDGGMAVKEAPDYDTVSENAREAMNFCFNAGILKGDASGNLNPRSPVTREEMATLLSRYCAFVEIGNRDAAGMAITEFTDYAAIQSWAHESIIFCLQNGVLRGNADGSYKPQSNVTRAECAQMLVNTMQISA